ncbi:hypothetical protein RHGRI_008088 [Rhododendron griersonianum]|uniref:Uncharacterized protein n=1 Tax=Rhododendron griersonianum TaxID=479676 RepID=A0AAV6KZZ3_9ERIC|nr:hypothetical protein RHGRI_008088 [Rhododendron griersonianum]
MTKKSSSKRMSMGEIRAKWKALGDKGKQKYIEKAKLSSEAYKMQKVKVDSQENSKETFITRTQLKTACDIIRNLEPQQVESVKAMGFGGLLRLKCTRLDRKLCEQLLFYFEHYTPAKDFISPCACRPSPRLIQWGDEEIRDRIHWLDQSSSRKINKEQDMKEPKIKPSSKRSRKMAINIGDIMSSTAPPSIGMNKRQKKCQQEMPRTRLKGSQPVKKNANEVTQKAYYGMPIRNGKDLVEGISTREEKCQREAYYRVDTRVDPKICL